MAAFAALLDAIPEVPTTAYRNAFYTSAVTTINQRVHNLETGNIERWDGTTWLIDFVGAQSSAGGVIFTGSASPNGGQVGSPGDEYVQQISATVTLLWLKQSGLLTNTGWQALSATGTGAPEGAVAAPIGVTYAQTDGSNGTVIWVKGYGSSSTGWTRISTADGRANAQRFLSLLHRNAEDATLLLVADSTGTSTYWSPIFFASLAALFPAYTVTLRYWSTVSNAYGTPTTIQTGTGANTLNIWNCAISGANTATHTGPYHYAMVGAPAPDYCIVSLGHNENATADYWEPQMLELISSLTQTIPQTDFCLVGQNPSALDDNQALRARVYERVAAWYGMGWIDIETFMNDTGGAAVYTSADHIHPNATGSAFWAACTIAAFQYCETAPTQPATFPWLETGDELLLNGDFSNFPSTASVPTGWVAGGSATITRNVTNYESANGYAVTIQASGAAAAKMQQTFNGTKCAGKWLTMVARIYVASGQPSSAGELGLSDHVSSDTNSRITTAGQGAFRWVVHQHFVDPASTQITAIIYGDQTTTNGACTVDRVSLRIGRLPMTSQTGGAVPLNRLVAGTSNDGVFKFGTNTAALVELWANGAAGSARNVTWGTAGVARWIAQATVTAESGGNAGSNFSLLARDDTGASIDVPLTITRAAGGNITISRPLVGQTAPANTNSTVMASTAYVDRTPGGSTITAAAPAATTSATAVMMGVNSGASIVTPTKTGRVLFTASGQMANSLVGDGVTVDLRTSTGTGPSNGTAVTGTLRGIAQTNTVKTAGQVSGFTIAVVVTGLTLAQAYWADVSLLAVTAGSASVTGVTITAVEI